MTCRTFSQNPCTRAKKATSTTTDWNHDQRLLETRVGSNNFTTKQSHQSSWKEGRLTAAQWTTERQQITTATCIVYKVQRCTNAKQPAWNTVKQKHLCTCGCVCLSVCLFLSRALSPYFPFPFDWFIDFIYYLSIKKFCGWGVAMETRKVAVLSGCCFSG